MGKFSASLLEFGCEMAPRGTRGGGGGSDMSVTSVWSRLGVTVT